MIRARTILAIILIAIGLVWIGQGTGLLQGTGFMVGDMKWAVIGAVAVVAGIALGWLELSHRHQA
jgi:predicted anti-sigma-YlaC factor YlaD